MVQKAFIKTFLELETAETEKERQKGLQDRKQLDKYKGMIFNFDKEKKQSIWMKNTYIPLDIVFLCSDGTVLNIEQGEPQSEEHIFSDGACKHVLELKQGMADRLNISRGDDLGFLISE
jgi:uncharacterized membrane protein (UPF0127 family)